MTGARQQLQLFFTNPVLLACVSSWFCAQFIKTLIKLFSGKINSLSELFELLLWRTGSMPSSHSAVVACACTTIGFRNGINSDIFILSFVVFLITIRDAVGVRRANGIQAKRINEITCDLKLKGLIDLKPIKEVQGHTPIEVLIGCFLGLVIGLAFSVLK